MKLVIQSYLPMQTHTLWQKRPEQFIELEDENYFLSEYDLDAGCSLNLLSYQLLEKLISSFYTSCYPYLVEEMLPSYFNGTVKISNELIEDSLLTITGMLGKIQKDIRTPVEKRLDITYVLSFIIQNKWQNILFKRRFTHILAQWIKLLPKAHFLNYFKFLITSLSEMTDYVIIYEHCHCIHEMIKEIDYWIKKAENG